jgi:protein involved in polysaccharide export with SLBB domain
MLALTPSAATSPAELPPKSPPTNSKKPRLKTEIAEWDAGLQDARQKSLGLPNPGAEPVAPILPGETLEIFVEGRPEFSGEYQVRRGGHVILPQIGRVLVSNMDLPRAEAAVRRALEFVWLEIPELWLKRGPRSQ